MKEFVLSKKKQILFLVFLVLVAISIFITVNHINNHPVQNKAQADVSTILSFDPSSTDNPIVDSVTPGSTVDLPVWIDPDPGSSASANAISVITLKVDYDSTKLQPLDSANCITSTGTLPVTITNATCTNGTVLIRLAASDVSNFVTT